MCGNTYYRLVHLQNDDSLIYAQSEIKNANPQKKGKKQ